MSPLTPTHVPTYTPTHVHTLFEDNLTFTGSNDISVNAFQICQKVLEFIKVESILLCCLYGEGKNVNMITFKFSILLIRIMEEKKKSRDCIYHVGVKRMVVR